MMIDDLMKEFSVPRELKKHFELVLTHEQVLNETGETWFLDDLEYYGEIGKRILDYEFELYILQHVTDDLNVVNAIEGASKHIFVDKFFELYHLEEAMRLNIVVEMNSILRLKMADRLIGFVYSFAGLRKIKQILQPIMRPEYLVFKDYKTVLNTASAGAPLQFKLLEESGKDHEKMFRYELVFGKTRTIGTGKSKKEAQQDCARKYCEKRFTMEQMISIMATGKKTDAGGKKIYRPSEKERMIIADCARRFQIEKKEIEIAVTHPSFKCEYRCSGDFYFVNGLGSYIKEMFILKILRDHLKKSNQHERTLIKNEIRQSHQIDCSVLKKFHLDQALRMPNMQRNTSWKFYDEIDNAIFYFIFAHHGGAENEFTDAYESACMSFVRKLDLRYIDPSSKLQEMFPTLYQHLGKTYQEAGKAHDPEYTCTITFLLKDGGKIGFAGKDGSKKESMKVASLNVLHFMYEKVIPFCQGHFHPGSDHKKICSMLHAIAQEPKDFIKIACDNEFPGFKNWSPSEMDGETSMQLIQNLLDKASLKAMPQETTQNLAGASPVFKALLKTKGRPKASKNLFHVSSNLEQHPLDKDNAILEEIRGVEEKVLKQKLSKMEQELKETKKSVKSMRSLLREQDETLKVNIAQMGSQNNRTIYNYEIRKELEHALKHAVTEIDIISPWISSYLMQPLYPMLDELAGRGVTVKIRYGIGDDHRRDSTEAAADEIKKRYQNIGDVRLQSDNTHSKLLICDDDYFIVTSFNFLSFLGDYSNGHTRGELGMVCHDKETLKKLRLKFFQF